MAYIAIDIGHGTNTAGKGVRGYKEHDFNSKLGLRLKELLELNGHKVLFGQQPFSKEIGLTTRTNLYNREKVDLVVSIHANANSDANVNGRCVFYWHTSTKGKRLAELVADEIKGKGYSTHGNGLHASKIGSWTNLHMVREPKAPAILIEHGFMTGNKDFDLIFGDKQDRYIEDMAQADAKAIQRYYGRVYVKTDPVKVSKPKPKPQPKPQPKPKKDLVTVDGYLGPETVRALQSYFGLVVDGEMWGQFKGNQATKAFNQKAVKYGKGGSPVVKALQRKIGATADGVWGTNTTKALQRYLGTPVDGEIWRPSSAIKELQRRLNAGTF